MNPPGICKLPAGLEAYFADLDGGRFEESAHRFAEDAIYAVPPDAIAKAGFADTGARCLVRGRSGLLERFSERGKMPHVHQFMVSARAGDTWMIEGVGRNTETQEPWASFCARARMSSDGLIEHYMAFFSIPPVPPPSPRGVPEERQGDAKELVERFLDMRGAEDVEGVQETLDDRAFLSTIQRGSRPGEDTRQNLTHTESAPWPLDSMSFAPGCRYRADLVAVNDSTVLLCGHTEGPSGIFLGSAQVTDDLKIARYIEYQSIDSDYENVDPKGIG